MIRKSTFSLTDTAILAAFCIFLSIIEYMIPKPMPFMRLGLAHLPVLLSLLIFPARGTLLLTLLKILGQGLVNGTLFSYVFLFSAAGSVSSTLAMLIVYRLFRKRISLIGVSVCGAMVSNIVQILLARVFIFGRAAVLIAPPFLAVGIISSVLLGLFAAGFASRSEWISNRTGRDFSNSNAAADAMNTDKDLYRKSFSGLSLPGITFLFGLLCIPAFVFQHNTIFIISETVFFIIFSVLRGKHFRLLPNLLMALGIITASLLVPYGRVIAEIGALKITMGAIEAGARRAAVIIGLIYISRASVLRGLVLPGKLGNMLSLVFYYFEKLTEGERISRTNIFSQLDKKLLRLSCPFETEKEKPVQDESAAKLLQYIVAALPMLFAWVLFVLETLC